MPSPASLAFYTAALLSSIVALAILTFFAWLRHKRRTAIARACKRVNERS